MNKRFQRGLYNPAKSHIPNQLTKKYHGTILQAGPGRICKNRNEIWLGARFIH